MAMGDGDKQMGMMDGNMMPMMQRMMKMHASMMGGQGSMMEMMDRDMMTTMLSGSQPHEMAAQMAEKMREFDADSDDELTLDEFEALHMSVIRARMVDRFQHLDADGNGQISQDEMEDAGMRMSKMKGTSSRTDMEGHHDSE
ncbi:calcium-binding protein [Tritonibacter mobilis]|nr:calcium-binding protein [Tritonibacter mobilis]